MKMQRILLALTFVNFVLLAVNLGQARAARAQAEQSVPPVIRAHALQIVDEQGHERATIKIQPAISMGGKSYPETVLLRLGDPDSEPGVKLTTSVDGSALGLSNGHQGGVQLYARDTLGSFIRVIERNGKQHTFRP